MKSLKIYLGPIQPFGVGIGVNFAGLLVSVLVLVYFLHPVVLEKRFHYQVISDFRALKEVAGEIADKLNKYPAIGENIPGDLFSVLEELSSKAGAEVLIFNANGTQPNLWTTNEFIFSRQELAASGKFFENQTGIFLTAIDSVPGYLIVVFKPVIIKYTIQNQYFNDHAAGSYKGYGDFHLRLQKADLSTEIKQITQVYEVSFLHPATGCRVLVFILLSLSAVFIFGLFNTIIDRLITDYAFALTFKLLATLIILFLYNSLFTNFLGGTTAETGSSLSLLGLRIATPTFLMGSLLLLYDVYALTSKQLFKTPAFFERKGAVWAGVLLFLASMVLIFWILEDVVESALVDFDSSVFLGLSFSSVAILLGIALLLTALSRLVIWVFFLPNRQITWFSILLLAVGATIFFIFSFLGFTFLLYGGMILLATGVLAYVKLKGYFKSSAIISSVILLLLSFSVSLQLNDIQAKKDKSKQQLILYTIDSKEAGDPITSHLFSDRVPLIQSDTFLIENLIKERKYDEAQEYIRSRHFSGYWDQFNITVTVCFQEDSIRISPNMTKESCFDYFGQFHLKQKKTKIPQGFFLVEYGQNMSGYLGIVDIDAEVPINVFVELIPKNILRNVNLSEILTDRRTPARIDLGNFSFARYTGGRLVSHRGVVSFPFVLPDGFTGSQKEKTIIMDGIIYSILNSSNGSTYIIGKESNSIVNFFAIFSLLFILSAMGFLFFEAGLFGKETPKRVFLDFLSVRLQVFIVLVLVVSLLVIGIFFLKTYSDIYKKRFSAGIIEKAHSLAIEFQHKIEQFGDDWVLNKQMTQAFSIKLGNIFFTDIHLFDSRGELLTSTSPVLFERFVSARRIHPAAYRQLYVEQKPFFVQKEKVGSYDYYSGYMPLRNSNHQLLAVINLPQISQIPEMDYEATKFISTFISIYTFLIILAVLLTLLLSNQIVKPLIFLKNSLAELKIGRKNVKIHLKRKDEIGQLIELYNELVDRLELAIQELKIRERESAWRDVARQIAHEIRNPLTPIKLQIQFLARSYDPHNQEWQKRYQTFSVTLLDQIDALEQLANSFSEFVKMPEQTWEKVQLYNLLNETCGLFEGFGGKLILEAGDDCRNLMINGDYQQMKRLFVNLIKNAIQSINQPERGVVTLSLRKGLNHVMVMIQDNGSGIDDDFMDKVFMPNFTTKSSGMGLGLYIAKNIAEQHNGEIRFESRAGKGTIFWVRLPLAETTLQG